MGKAKITARDSFIEIITLLAPKNKLYFSFIHPGGSGDCIRTIISSFIQSMAYNSGQPTDVYVSLLFIRLLDQYTKVHSISIH